MKRFPMRWICYGALWLGLALAVCLAWFLGGRKGEKEETVLPAQEALTLPAEAQAKEEPEEAESKEELKGIWVPYMSLETAEHTREAFEDNFREIADLAAEKGFNALFVHVRPFCDALYPSSLFPWSHLLTGEQGKDPGFDPMEFMVDYTHQKGMAFHAWINPLRVKTADTPFSLAQDNPYKALREDYPCYFMEVEGGVYLDPAYPYVRSLIADGAKEIVENYPVDGVHFDDYFYPTREEGPDQEGYALYADNVEEPMPLEDWRRANISAMVQEVYRAVKGADPKASFGISPQGNLENDWNMGADVKTWCGVPGYVDYLCPQLYYSFENPALGYGEALSAWTSLPRHRGLRLYAGLALYKAGSDADQGTWAISDDILSRQILVAREAECSGVVLYSSQYLEGEQTEKEVENAVAILKG